MGGTRLIDRVRGTQGKFPGGPPGAPGAAPGARPGGGATDGAGAGADFQRLKLELQNEIIEALDFEQVSTQSREEIAAKLRGAIQERVEARNLPLNRMEREKVAEEILDNLLGLGPLEQLIRDPEVNEIMVNGPNTVYIERKGKLVLTNIKFQDNSHLKQIIDRIVSAVGRRVDETTPMVDARMTDGSRFNAIIPPLAIDGCCVTIRRFGTVPITSEDLVALGSCPRPLMEVIRGAVKAKLNIIISGGTGSGKTTLLNVMSSFIPEGERIITIEDSAELQMQQTHVIRLETRPSNLEGKGEVNQRDLVKNCLRMRPDRIILGEIRGGEAIDMLTAMNTGHDGSLATVHANDTRDALARFETMVGIGMPNMSDKTIRETIARALDMIVQQTRLADGSRRIVAITEVTGMEGPVITSQDIFVFEQRTVDENGKVRGAFKASGIRPRFAGRLAAHGIRLSQELFRFEMEV
jgi:pilus assembly protein CpaF